MGSWAWNVTTRDLIYVSEYVSEEWRRIHGLDKEGIPQSSKTQIARWKSPAEFAWSFRSVFRNGSWLI